MPSPVGATDHTGDRDHDPASILADTESRQVIPLSPRQQSSALPTLDSIVDQSAQTAPDEETADSTMLLDYMSRLARYEPRLRRYAAHRRGNTGREPITAFNPSGIHNSSVAPTPLPPHESAAGTPKTGVKKSSVRGFSLLDLERALLSVTPEWWKGLGGGGKKSRASSPSRPESNIHEDDAARFDVDLSEAFGASAMSTEHDASASTSTDKSVPMPKDKGPGLFLNYYTSAQVISTLERTGILSGVAKLGYTEPSLIFDTSDEFQHRLSLVDAALFKPDIDLRSTERFLIDLFMKRRRKWDTDQMVCYQLMRRVEKAGSWEALRDLTGEIRAPFVGLEGAAESRRFIEQGIAQYSKLSKSADNSWDVTEIAWMQMHNPRSKDTRPLLPGQRFPGLGLGRKVGEVMEQMALDSDVTDGLLNFPFYWHLAVAYSTRGWRHLDPIVEAYVAWITEQMQPYIEAHGLSFVAWAVSLGHLRRVTEQQSSDTTWTQISDRLERWSPSEQVYATGSGMRAWLYSDGWQSLYDKWLGVFRLNGGAMGQGVGVVQGPIEGQLRARLVLDLEGCPECWRYSKIWSNRDPETGDFL